MYLIQAFGSKSRFILSSLILIFLIHLNVTAQSKRRTDFDKGWRFYLGEINGAENPNMSDGGWRTLDLPHDWSIEGKFSKDNPATYDGGALPGGTGWYRKTFTVPVSDKDK